MAIFKILFGLFWAIPGSAVTPSSVFRDHSQGVWETIRDARHGTWVGHVQYNHPTTVLLSGLYFSIFRENTMDDRDIILFHFHK